jgi:hypothetical protein
VSTACTTAVFRHSASKGSARLVLLAMADEANDQGLLTAYKRSQSHLARKANVDQRTVGRAITELQELGELALLAAGNGRASSDYRLLLPGLEDHDEGGQAATPAPAARRPSPGSTPPQGGQAAHPIIPVSPGATPVPPEPSRDTEQLGLVAEAATRTVDELFAEFWSTYPRKTDKGSAWQAWRRALRKVGGTAEQAAAVITAGAARYAADPNREDRYTKHPATWLNAEAWANPPLPPKAGRPGAIPAPTTRRDVQEGRVQL